MITTKKIQIKNKVFTKNDIFLLSKVFQDEHDKNNQDEYKNLTYTLKCDFENEHQFNSLDELKNSNKLDLKKVSVIEIELYTHHTENINLSIEHIIDDSIHNKIIVKGPNELLVNGLIGKFSEILESVRPQKTLLNEYENSFLGLVAVAIGYIIIFIIAFFINNPNPPIQEAETSVFLKAIENNLILEYAVKISVYWFIGITFAIIIKEKSLKLWPSIEFDFGPEHLKKEKKKRNVYIFIITILIIPFLINLLS